ncbi:MAG TPA: hypothetical protein VFZ66_27655 [Herpetosiphonaceae bacterium]
MPESTAKTAAKTIRLGDDLLEHIQALIGLSPDLTKETDVLVRSVEIGHLILAAQAARPSMTPYGGYDPKDLAVLLRNYLLPAFEFLAQQQALPTLLVGHAGSAPPGPFLANDPHPSPTPADTSAVRELSNVIEPGAATSIEESTGGFLD